MEGTKGVFFEITDYASFFQRVACLVIDFVFVWILYFLLLFILENTESSVVKYSFLMIYILFLPTYFTIIKASNLKTLGYRMMKIKIVNIKGERPKFHLMLYRFLLGLLIPTYLIFDILWLINDENKQSVRDKFSGTYVIKNNAIPKGSGTIYVENYYLLGFNLLFKTVNRE